MELNENNLKFKLGVTDSKSKIDVFNEMLSHLKQILRHSQMSVSATVIHHHYYPYIWCPRTDRVYSPEWHSGMFIAKGDERDVAKVLSGDILDAFEIAEDYFNKEKGIIVT